MSSVACDLSRVSVAVAQPRKVWVPELAQLPPWVLYEASETWYEQPWPGVPSSLTWTVPVVPDRPPLVIQLEPPSVE
jgi:hypothetical protein